MFKNVNDNKNNTNISIDNKPVVLNKNIYSKISNNETVTSNGSSINYRENLKGLKSSPKNIPISMQYTDQKPPVPLYGHGQILGENKLNNYIIVNKKAKSPIPISNTSTLNKVNFFNSIKDTTNNNNNNKMPTSSSKNTLNNNNNLAQITMKHVVNNEHAMEAPLVAKTGILIDQSKTNNKIFEEKINKHDSIIKFDNSTSNKNINDVNISSLSNKNIKSDSSNITNINKHEKEKNINQEKTQILNEKTNENNVNNNTNDIKHEKSSTDNLFDDEEKNENKDGSKDINNDIFDENKTENKNEMSQNSLDSCNINESECTLNNNENENNNKSKEKEKLESFKLDSVSIINK